MWTNMGMTHRTVSTGTATTAVLTAWTHGGRRPLGAEGGVRTAGGGGRTSDPKKIMKEWSVEGCDKDEGSNSRPCQIGQQSEVPPVQSDGAWQALKGGRGR